MDDHIILVGFSRVAFICRCIANLVAFAHGLLNKSSLGKLGDIFDKWERQQFDERDNGKDSRPVRIEHLVLFDTVASVRNSRGQQQFTFVNSHLKSESDVVERISHALAVHEHRKHFVCIPIVQAGKVPNVSQMWFPGFHSNVGGSDVHGAPALFALAWMMSRIEGHDRLSLNLSHIEALVKRDMAAWLDSGERADSKKGIHLLSREGPRIPGYQQWVNGEFSNRAISNPSDVQDQMHVSLRFFVDFFPKSSLHWPEGHYTVKNVADGSGPGNDQMLALLRTFDPDSTRAIRVVEGASRSFELGEGAVDNIEVQFLKEVFEGMAAAIQHPKAKLVRDFAGALDTQLSQAGKTRVK